MPLSFLNLERLRVLSACMVLMLAAVTVSSILSTIQMMKPIRILMEQVPITAEYRPAKFLVSYKTFAPDGSLETVSQDSVHRKLLESNQLQQGGEMQTVDEGYALDQLGTSVDELLYQKSLQSTIPEAEELGMSVNLMDQKSFQEWMLDDDEGLFFYPMGFLESTEAMLQPKLRGAEPIIVKRSMQEVDETSTTTEVLPVVMVGVASAVIACAVMLYITDMRDRCRHKRYFDKRESRGETASHKQVHPSLTRTATSASSNMSERWVEGGGQRDGAFNPMMLPPYPHSADDVEDMEMTLACVPPKEISLSRLSTMTSSLVDGNVCEDRIVPYDYSQAVGGGVWEQHAMTESTDTNRVGGRTDLGSLVQSPEKHERNSAVMSSSPMRSESSRCSSLTDISEGTESTPQLAGETVLKDEEATHKKKIIVPRMSMDFSPETPLDEERDAIADSHLCVGADVDVRESPSQQTQLEHLIASIPVTDPTGRRSFSPVHDMQAVPIQDYIRDIYFVVGIRTSHDGVDFGLDLLDATCPVTHPSVVAVHAKSPLLGRIFTGDFVLHVNDTDVAGQSAVQVAKLLECDNGDTQDYVAGGATKTSTVIKLTIMSSHVDGPSDADGASDADGEASLDLGFPDSAVEV